MSEKKKTFKYNIKTKNKINTKGDNMNVLKSKTTFLNKDMSLVKKNGRNSNVELLRIIAMIVIIIHHYMYHGLLKTEFYNINYYIANILSIGGALGVDIFFIISGYYIYKSKITARKISL